MQDAIVIQEAPAASPIPVELLLLFHGVGSSSEDLVPLGQDLASQRPGAWVVSIRSPDPSDAGSGWQWFSVRGISEQNRPARVAAAMPSFLRTVASWQDAAGVRADMTTLIGFSQGAIMALEATQEHVSPARRVIAIAGRFSSAPRLASANTQIHLLQGDQDPIVPAKLAIEAQATLQALGASSTLDRFPGLAHGIDARVVACVGQRLRS